MSTPVISVENVSKLYRLGEVGTGTLRHDFNRWWHRLRGKDDPYEKIDAAGKSAGGAVDSDDNLWALKDVSFEVQQGEVLGIIGRNGAGKSTLLKILSRVTTPTRGRIRVKGRIASLLEVGTGFHPELSGRDNIFLNGAILGMRKQELARKLDEIVDFSGCERFIDTPVKRYSSGMYVRLAFSVAAHLETEILIVDEVLAVGDTEFQKKCLGKMDQVAKCGRTILFVSHNTSVIQTLCSSAILMRNGVLEKKDRIEPILSIYMSDNFKKSETGIENRHDRRGLGEVRLVAIHVQDANGKNSISLLTGKPARFVFEVNGYRPATVCRFTIINQHNLALVHFNSQIESPDDTLISGPSPRFVCEVPSLPLSPGRYFINVAIQIGEEMQDHLEAAASFDIESAAVGGRAIVPHSTLSICLPHRWIKSTM